MSKNQVIFGGNYFQLPNVPGWIVWDKFVPEGVSFADAELAWTSFDRVLRIAKIPYCGFIGLNGEKRIHSTQKPVNIYAWILRNYAKPGDKIIDTHLGSGSSRIAAYDLGFDFYGCELDKDYFEAQEKRFKQHIAQQKLFAPVKPELIQTTLL